MTSDTILDDFRDFLVVQDVVRIPRIAGVRPPLWLEPRDGAPAPGEGTKNVEKDADIVLSAFRATGIPSLPYEGFLAKPHVALWYRVRRSDFAAAKHREIMALIHDKRNWLMGTQQVHESMCVRELQPLGSDESGFTYTAEFQFHVWF